MTEPRHTLCMRESLVVDALCDSLKACNEIFSKNKIPSNSNPEEHKIVTMQEQYDKSCRSLCAMKCYVKLLKQSTSEFLPGFLRPADWLRFHRSALARTTSLMTTLLENVLLTTYVYFLVSKRLAARSPIIWKRYAAVLDWVAGTVRAELCGSRDERASAWTDHFSRRVLDRLAIYDDPATPKIFPTMAAASPELVVTWMRVTYRELLHSWLYTHGLKGGSATQACLRVLFNNLNVTGNPEKLMIALEKGVWEAHVDK